MKIKSKIVLGIAASGTALALIPMFAAFEAHVINVTAKIENALSVPTEALDFGTVFPQEQLEKFLNISLSQSFQDETNADDVEYIIRQKPKCAVTADDGETLVGPTWTGHVVVEGETTRIDCEVDKPTDLPSDLPAGQTYGVLPDLCPYISKHPDDPEDNDGSLDSFHVPFVIATTTDNPFLFGDETVEIGSLVWNDVKGRLAKSEDDTEDEWTIDLKVPCFGGFCAQDWADFVTGINPTANPDDYTQSIENEHKVFGCNLWVEVTEVSRFDTGDLTVTKVVNPDSGDEIDLTPPTVGSFSLFVGAEPVVSGVVEEFDPGIYTVSESPIDPDYDVSFSGACSGTDQVTIAENDNLACTITNTFDGVDDNQ